MTSDMDNLDLQMRAHLRGSGSGLGSGRQPDPQSGLAAGFVLPYVLAVIAIIAITVIIAAERLQRITQTVTSFQEQLVMEGALMSAEAETSYSLLIGKRLNGGLDINPDTPFSGGFLAEIMEDTSAPKNSNTGPQPDMWVPNGAIRLSNQADRAVFVALQDIRGLVSLNVGADDDLIALLGAEGVSGGQAETLVARLNDYIDADRSRRFMGAEQADYKIRQRQPPTNAPLRNFDELSSVLGWDEIVDKINYNRFLDRTSLGTHGKVSTVYMRPELVPLLGGEKSSIISANAEDIFSTLTAANQQPSGRYRLTFWVGSEDGRFVKRLIEINNALPYFNTPFMRREVYQQTLSANDDLPNLSPTGLSYVLNAAALQE